MKNLKPPPDALVHRQRLNTYRLTVNVFLTAWGMGLTICWLAFTPVPSPVREAVGCALPLIALAANAIIYSRSLFLRLVGYSANILLHLAATAMALWVFGFSMATGHKGPPWLVPGAVMLVLSYLNPLVRVILEDLRITRNSPPEPEDESAEFEVNPEWDPTRRPSAPD